MSQPIPDNITTQTSNNTGTNKSNFWNALGSGLSTLLAPVTSLVGGIVNYFSTKETNKSNEKINKQNLDYNTAMTQQQWERDDTAHQREVADLQAAGLSPLAATNGANTSSALGAPNPIAMQAPQLDVNMLVQSMLQNKALDETKRHNLIQEGQKDVELQQTADEIKLKARQLNIQSKQVQNQIDYNAKYIEHVQNTLNETKRANQESEKLRQLQILSETYIKEIEKQTQGKFNYKIYDNEAEYIAALKEWSSAFDIFITQELQETSVSTSNSYSNNWNGSLSGNASSGSLFKGTSSNAGVGLTGSVGEGESGSGSYSYNISKQQEAKMIKFYADHPMPVFFYFKPKD